jgi:diacylglycerol kinase family enzyme
MRAVMPSSSLVMLWSRGADVVVAIGGDGTLNETVNGLYQGNQQTGRTAAFAVIPLGTGSDFVKVLETVNADDIAGGIARLQKSQTAPYRFGVGRNCWPEGRGYCSMP